MASPLNVLLVEDSEQDAALVLRELHRGGFEPAWQRVDCAAAMTRALQERNWDVVLADYEMPAFTAAGALSLAQAGAPYAPFIVVSGAVGEEQAVEMMRAGAHDYVMKDKLARLVPAIRRELRESELRRAFGESEARKAAMMEAALDCIVSMDASGRIIDFNPAAETTFGYRREEVVGRNMASLLIPERLRAAHAAGLARCVSSGQGQLLGRRVEMPALCKDGVELTMELTVVRLPSLGPPMFTGFMRDITERKRVALENARLYRKAQESIRVRDEFLAIAGHELKTPITPLRMQAQSLLRCFERSADGIDTNKLRNGLKQIERATARLERLIETLLEVSEFTVGNLVLHPAPSDLEQLARRAVERARNEAGRAGCALALAAERAVLGYWDETRVQQALGQLLDNAVKYGAGQPIEIEVDGDELVGRVSVRDYGCGMSADEQLRVFERFERRASVSHFGGFGLGLWVVRQVALAHGGRVDIWSRPGEGARFTLELPRSPPTHHGAAVDGPHAADLPKVSK